MARNANNIDKIYLTVCRDLLRAPVVNGTRELNNVKLQLWDITQNIVSIRDISDAYLFGELIWYFRGNNSTKFISAFSKMWERLSDDGFTNNSAYGFLMQGAFGFNQIEKVIELLTVDPNSRRAVINLNTPNKLVIETKDEPCTIALQFMIRDNKLHCTTMMRSNDIWFGLPYDVAFFTELQKYMADRLGVEYGVYTHFVTSLHMYDRDAEAIAKIVDDPISQPIDFNRKAFHDNLGFLEGWVDLAIEYGFDAKEALLDMLKTLNIYHGKEVKNECEKV